jgi:hypothetical protein
MAAEAGCLVGFDFRQERGVGMRCAFLEGTCPCVAVKTFSVVVSLVQPYICGLWCISDVIDIEVTQAIQLGFYASKHCIARVACVTRFIGWNAMILEVVCCQMPWVIDTQALAVWLHDVTTEAKPCALGILQLRAKTHT